MDLTHQLSTIHVAGKVEGYKNDLRLLSGRLKEAPLWRPGVVLLKQCQDGIRMVEDLEARFERKLVVTLIGPSGSGKSTLLNAIAGVDDLSPVGHQRPTTREVVVFSKDDTDAEQLIDRIGRESVTVRWQPGAASLDHVILLDTPDTDSMAQEAHIPILKKVISLSDILLCVFDAENPKRRDHVDFLASYVGLFGGSALVALVNKCDRQEKNELLESIMPDFSAYLTSAWGRSVDAMFCTAGRRHLKEPKWDESAGPKHDLDQFQVLREMIFGTMDQAGFVVDSRLNHAEQLCGHLTRKVVEEARRDEKSLSAALKEMRRVEKNAVKNVLAALKENDGNHFLGVNVLLYQKLAQRWLGPMGWMVAIWARLLLFGAGAAAVFRFGHPIRQIWGMVSSFKQYKESKKAVTASQDSDHMTLSMEQYHLSLMSAWPNIAKMLVNAGFNRDLHHADAMLPDGEKLKETLAGLWQGVLSETIDKAARRLSHGFFQLLFNLPVLAVLGYTAWLTLKAFYQGNYLSSDFFVHAVFTIGIILFFCFFLFQAMVRMVAGGERMISKAFEGVKRYFESHEPVSANPVEKQLLTILELANIEEFEE